MSEIRLFVTFLATNVKECPCLRDDRPKSHVP
jgi:hypothetical protein